jgi:hypothetical protein
MVVVSKLINVIVKAVPRNHSVEHVYELKPGRNGVFDFYEAGAPTKNAKYRLANLPSTLDDALALLKAGYAGRFYANGPTYFRDSVFSKDTQTIIPIYR